MVEKTRTRWGNAWKWIIIVLFAAGLILIARRYITLVAVTGESMDPTYKNGELVIGVSPDIRYPELRQVAVVKGESTKGQTLIKRIVALPGDTIVIENGYFYRNGKKVEEKYPLIEDSGILNMALKLGSDEYFVLGDNRNSSMDSRTFGPVKKEDIRYIVTDNREEKMYHSFYINRIDYE